MATLDMTPDIVDLVGYAGDTLTFKITATTAFIAGRELVAQIRATPDSAVVDATFVVTPPSVQDGPAYLTLPSAETARLAGLGGGSGRVLRAISGRAVVAQYSGVWDAQLAPAAGGDPVNTVALGTLNIGGDVTRQP